MKRTRTRRGPRIVKPLAMLLLGALCMNGSGTAAKVKTISPAASIAPVVSRDPPRSALSGIALTPAARFTAAQEAPCSTAQRLYEALASDSMIADSMRAVACGRRADLAFALREYGTAREFYKRASLVDAGHDDYRYRWGLAALANGDSAEAIKVLEELSSRTDGALSYEARVVLGQLRLKRGDYAGAMEYFRKTGGFSAANNWSLPALIGKLSCARHLGLADSAAAYERALAPFSKNLLEKEELKRAREIPLAKSTEPETEQHLAERDAGKNTSTADTGNGFALQIAAFGSKEHALTLKKGLAKKFPAVACVPAKVDERTFYRVWVGNFRTRDEAERFGKSQLIQQGYVYRVVVKEK